MRIISSIAKMQQFALRARHKGFSVGFVPTMGALHEGHLSLIRRARKENDLVVLSIFVNPAQFGPKEDFKKYPRSLKEDSRLCRSCGVDVIFYPQAKAMYPPGYLTYVTVEKLSDKLCGRARPGHFKGVATVVTKLFNIVQPTSAYFGQKDAQQSVIIRKLTADLNMPVKIKVLPTLRDKDGLALSSRNAYLNPKERREALVLPQALKRARSLIKRGVRDSAKIIAEMRGVIRSSGAARVDYISVVDTVNLEPLGLLRGDYLIALAARVGKTRLIDNITD
ncbi:MAG TPA: pantoate--beta-alanine ligase [Candidatus Margulisiibacteriota bacterium]|nr:pantoate--beta-alanine ligase [Candidatus Margulisiibacteriota bacterium]